MGSSKKPTLGYWYPRVLHFGVSLPVDEVVEIIAGGRTAWKGSVTRSQRIWIAAKELWGGKKGEGGVEGNVDVMMGEPDQAPSEYLRSRQGNPQPAYRGKLTLLFAGTLFGAMNPYLKPVAVRVRKALTGWDGSPWYPEKAVIWLQDGKVRAMNPAHIIYRSIVNLGSMRAPRGIIDDASFRAAADYYHAQKFGICTTYDGSQSASEFRKRIAFVAGCNYWQDRRDGRYRLQPVTAGYDVDSLPIVTQDDVDAFEEIQAGATDAVNRLSATWRDPETRQDRVTPPYTLLAGVRSAGRVIADTVDYPEIADEALAILLCQRDLDTRGKPIKQFNLTLKSRRHQFDPGSIFRLQLPEEGIGDMVCRLAELDLGTLLEARPRLQVAQDRFALGSTSFVKPIPSPPPPDITPKPAEFRQLIEVPYGLLAGSLTAAELTALEPDAGYLGVLAARPPVTTTNYALATAGPGEAFDERGIGDWAVTGQIAEAATALHQAVTLVNARNIERIVAGEMLLWGSEIVRVITLDWDSGALRVGRGCVDTVPVAHVAGERLWRLEDLASDEREYSVGETVRAKVLTRTPGAQLDLDAAPTDNLVIAQRAARPYPPARLRLNGEAYPAALYGPLTATWAHRDRVLQADRVLDTEAASTGPEPGTTYIARWFVDGAIARTQAGLTGTSDSFTPPAGSGGKTVRVEIEAVREGLTSWQRLNHTFRYVAHLISEEGARVVTEEGHPIILE